MVAIIYDENFRGISKKGEIFPTHTMKVHGEVDI
jgi:hypothetical protein